MRGGLIRLSEPAFTSVAPLEGLTNDGVRTATVGNDGSVWVATGHALNRFSGSAARSFDVSQTMALHSDRHGTLWVAGRAEDQPPGRQPVRGRSRSPTDPHESGHGAHHRLAGQVVALHGAQGRDDVGRQDRFALPDQGDIGDKACQSIFTDSQGRVWIGMLTAGVVVYDKGTFRTFGTSDGLGRGIVLAITEDREAACG